MKIGDLITRDGDYWLVVRYDPKRTRTSSILRADGVMQEIPHDEAVPVVANPSLDWPFVAAPLKPKWGPVIHLSRPNRPVGASDFVELRLYRDWLPSEPARAGGSIFLNPELRLQVGDYLLARHREGHASSVVIPANFGTVRQKQDRVAATKPKAERTAYTRLLDDDHFGDDEDD